jgi:probable O-glycosylation ligase (exosortase A-associated)
MRDLLLIVGVLAACLIALVRPVFGILAFTFLGFFNPHSFTWTFARALPFSLMVAVSTILGTLISSERKSFPVQRETILLLALWALFGFSTVFALRRADALDGIVQISKILLMVVMTMVLVNSEQRLLWLLRIIGLSLGFYALKGGIFAIVTGGNEMVYGPEDSFLYANNSIGLALAMNIPILLFLLKRERITGLRWVLRAMLIFSYPAIICTFSRGAWLGLAMVTMLAFLKSKYKFILVAVIGVLMVVLQMTIPNIISGRIGQRYENLVNYEDESSAQSRLWSWEFCKRVGMARPLTGGGFNYYSLDAYARYYPEYLARWPGKVWSCHSTWLSIFGEHGIPGMMLWVSLLICCFMSLRRIRAFGRAGPGQAHFADFADMVQSSLIAYLVVGTFLDAAYFDMFYYLVAMVVIAKQLTVVVNQREPSVSPALAIAKPA